jgi:hypothetical protein
VIAMRQQPYCAYRRAQNRGETVNYPSHATQSSASVRWNLGATTVSPGGYAPRSNRCRSVDADGISAR